MLDAQFFGVPQRRRRVFVVAYLGDWHPAAAVLFERESLHRHPAPGRKKKKDITPTISARTKGGGGLGTDTELDGGLIVRAVARMRGFGDYEIDNNVSALKQRDYKDATDLIIDSMVFQSKASATNSMNPGSISPTLDRGKGDGVAVVLPIHDQATRFNGKRGDKSDGKGNGFGVGKDGDPCPTLTKGDKHAVAFAQNQAGYALTRDLVVRRLTPVECERLQGFPDNYTRIPWRGKPAEQCPDGPRYKAIGNSMAVPVMRWIGNRIQAVEDVLSGN